MAGFLLDLLHRAASVGWVYDGIQFLAGDFIIKPKLKRRLMACHGRVLDIGGGTGAVGALLPEGCTYICLDNEMPKLQRLGAKHLGAPLLADGTNLPIRSGTIDIVTCALMAHHLAGEQLDSLLRESARVLKPEGTLIFMDPVMKPTRLPGRVLWALDRGSYPRTSSDLRRTIERYFRVREWTRLAVYHEYVIGVCGGDTIIEQ